MTLKMKFQEMDEDQVQEELKRMGAVVHSAQRVKCGSVEVSFTWRGTRESWTRAYSVSSLV